MTWGNAEKSCNQKIGPTGHGGNLVSIHDDLEMEFVQGRVLEKVVKAFP